MSPGPAPSLLSRNEVFPAPLKSIVLSPPNIVVVSISSNGKHVSGYSTDVTIQSDHIAPYVFLETTVPGRFSDNGFLLLPGVPTVVTFWGFDDYSVDDFKKHLRIVSLHDTYSA
eukprot:TRINITY_DN6177_c0_g1_i2.p1 TRINITY_DN6177_c0_g1~~TRINITY_DN6177_c0_g1_i2.p1  ORF type:complete len:114 (-),score=13.23 TRINITY_DN6177_c0_g1_i2:42-383(-)